MCFSLIWWICWMSGKVFPNEWRGLHVYIIMYLFRLVSLSIYSESDRYNNIWILYRDLNFGEGKLSQKWYHCFFSPRLLSRGQSQNRYQTRHMSTMGIHFSAAFASQTRHFGCQRNNLRVSRENEILESQIRTWKYVQSRSYLRPLWIN